MCRLLLEFTELDFDFTKVRTRSPGKCDELVRNERSITFVSLAKKVSMLICDVTGGKTIVREQLYRKLSS